MVYYKTKKIEPVLLYEYLLINYLSINKLLKKMKKKKMKIIIYIFF